jgi:hypothetical protein
MKLSPFFLTRIPSVIRVVEQIIEIKSVHLKARLNLKGASFLQENICNVFIISLKWQEIINYREKQGK